MRRRTISAAGRFAEELKSWRGVKGWTQEQAAQAVHVSLSNLQKIEGGSRTASLPLARDLDKAFGTPGTFQRLHELVALESHPSWFAPVVGYESTAARIHEWEMRGVPGLLQTEPYARAVIGAGRPHDTAEAIERDVTARLARQEALATAKPWWVLAEGVLHQMVGGREVMTDQLSRILDVAQGRGAVVQVLPFTATDAPGADGPISMYEFDDQPTVCYLEGYDGGRIVEDSREVARIATTFGMIKGCALSPRESIDLIIKARGVLDG